ncbi:MAG: LPP20 family lipoprotein [bacterium]
MIKTNGRCGHTQGFIVTLALLIMLPATLLGAPDWVTRLQDQPGLLQGVGAAQASGNEADDRARADNAAIAQIASQIHVEVTSTLKTFYKEETTESGDVTMQENVERISSQYAQETLEGVTIRDRWYDKKNKVYYSYAVIERSEVDRQFREKARRAVQMAADYHRYAKKAVGDGLVYAAVGNYIRALEELFPAQAYLKKKIEGDLDSSGRNEAVQARLESELAAILGRITLRQLSGMGQKADRVSGLPNPLVGEATYRTSSGATIPVRSMPLGARLLNATGRISASSSTDDMGRFDVRVLGIDEAGEEVVLLRVGVDLGELQVFRTQLPALFSQLERTSCTFDFKVDVASSIRIFVDIRETEGERPATSPYTKNVLTGALVEDQFRVIDVAALEPSATRNRVVAAIDAQDDGSLADAVRGAADYAVIGQIHSVVSDSVNAGYSMVFARAGAEVRVIDLATGRVVATSTVSEIKGAGNNSRKAHRKAIEGCAKQMVGDIRADLKSVLK